MTRTKSIYLALLAILLAPLAANADLITIEAIPTSPDYSGFTIVFDDTGDGLLQYDEVVSFSGVTIGGDFYEYFVNTPDLAGISTFSYNENIEDPDLITLCGGTPAGWCFILPTLEIVDQRFFNSNWIFASTSVPEPGTLALLGLGLVGMAARRKKKV